MRVYLTGAPEHMDPYLGFGIASWNIYRSLKQLGVDVHVKELNSNEPYEADIEICFDQPSRYRFMCPTSYKIGYTPWESTEFYPNWYRPLENVDEVWVPSQWNKVVFQRNVPNKEVFVYKHGLEHEYHPKRRKLDPNKPFTFLFIGEPFYRKAGQRVTEAFIHLFADNPNYKLIIKATQLSTISVPSKNGKIKGPPQSFHKNIITISDLLSKEEMLDLYDSADCVLYPTWGEGFGFIPLQALGMGIPVIATADWADYSEYITAVVDTKFSPSPWPEVHPGYMMEPNWDRFEKLMSNIKDKYEEASSFTFKNSFRLHQEYDWLEVTKPAVERLENIFKSRT